MTIPTPEFDLGHATLLLLGTKAELREASYGVIWRFGTTSDHESEWTSTSQPPSPDPIIGGAAAATPLYRPFSDYCAPHLAESQVFRRMQAIDLMFEPVLVRRPHW